MRNLLEVCWGKSAESEDGERLWLPVWVHLLDTYATSQIVAQWMPYNCERILLEDLHLDRKELHDFIGWLAATHDLGKLTSGFYYRDSVVFRTKDLYERMAQAISANGQKLAFDTDKIFSTPRHEAASSIAVERIIANATGREFKGRERRKLQNLISILAGHHGNPTSSELSRAERISYQEHFSIWNELQDELYVFLDKTLFDNNSQELLQKVLTEKIPPRSTVLLTSLLIMSDWLASTDKNYPLVPFHEIPSMEDDEFIHNRLNLHDSISSLGVNKRYDTPLIAESENIEEVFERRFGFPPNVLQKTVIDAIDYKLNKADNDPNALRDVYVIEAPMGYGKTEAALIAAEYINARTKQSGVFFGLPTMATANAIYSRFYTYLKSFGEEFTEDMEGYTLSLQHSKAHLSEEANAIRKEAEENVINRESYDNEDFVLLPSNFFNGRHTKPLNNFVVGTVDQFLTTSLKVKYNFWRHLGLASKTIILDEIHSLDGFMLGFLKSSLTWAAHYGVPVILVTATLDKELKEELIETYRKGKNQ